MKYSAKCDCGYETPLVENREEVDYELMEIHLEFCKASLEAEHKEEE